MITIKIMAIRNNKYNNYSKSFESCLEASRWLKAVILKYNLMPWNWEIKCWDNEELNFILDYVRNI